MNNSKALGKIVIFLNVSDLATSIISKNKISLLLVMIVAKSETFKIFTLLNKVLLLIKSVTSQKRLVISFKLRVGQKMLRFWKRFGKSQKSGNFPLSH